MPGGCIGIAGAAHSGGVLAMPLAELNVSVVRLVPPGTIHGIGLVTRLGRRVGFTEGALFDDDGRLLARGTGMTTPTPFPDVDRRNS
jgi:acyl-coenzyme A thioesterase PaaI-like protein